MWNVSKPGNAVPRLTTSSTGYQAVLGFRYLGLGAQVDDEQNFAFQSISIQVLELMYVGLGTQADDEKSFGFQTIEVLGLEYPGSGTQACDQQSRIAKPSKYLGSGTEVRVPP